MTKKNIRSNTLEEKFVTALNISSMELTTGYAQTKYISEFLLSKAKDHGIPVNIFRSTLISGHSVTGGFIQTPNHFVSLVKSCMQMGVAPKWIAHINFLPVDIIAKSIFSCSINKKRNNTVVNIVNTNNLSWLDFIAWLNTKGYAIKIISSMDWHDNYLSTINKDNALFTFLPLYTRQTISSQLITDNLKINHSNFLSILKESNIRINSYEKMLDVWFNYLTENYYL